MKHFASSGLFRLFLFSGDRKSFLQLNITCMLFDWQKEKLTMYPVLKLFFVFLSFRGSVQL